jgi:hypothetical protein
MDTVTKVAGEKEAQPPADPASPQWEASRSVSLLITQQQRQRLRELGFSEDAIREMTPAEAHKHLGLS